MPIRFVAYLGPVGNLASALFSVAGCYGVVLDQPLSCALCVQWELRYSRVAFR